MAATPVRLSSVQQYFPATNVVYVTASSTFASYNWPAQNLAVAIPFAVPFPYPVSRIIITNGSGASGSNWDVGIYTAAFVRLYSSGSTASTGNSVEQTFTPTNLILAPGQYYFAMANDSATTTNRGTGITSVTALEGRTGGMFQQSSAFPLPNPFVPAQWASTGYPAFALSRRSSDQ